MGRLKKKQSRKTKEEEKESRGEKREGPLPGATAISPPASAPPASTTGSLHTERIGTVLRKISGGGNSARTVTACETTRHHHWRHVGSRTAADESNQIGGSGTSSLSLSPYADGDLQNTQKHSKQLILVFLSCSRIYLFLF